MAGSTSMGSAKVVGVMNVAWGEPPPGGVHESGPPGRLLNVIADPSPSRLSWADRVCTTKLPHNSERMNMCGTHAHAGAIARVSIIIALQYLRYLLS